jgi:hypothetical protein
MKKTLSILVLLIAALMFISCNHDMPDVQQNKQDVYKSEFVKTFPTVSLNQSWDYSETKLASDDNSVLDYVPALTRGVYEGSEVLGMHDTGNGDPKSIIYNLSNVQTLNEFSWIRNNINNGTTKEWDPYAVNDLWVYYIHGNGTDLYFPTLGVHWINKGTGGAHDTEYITQMPITGYAFGSNWYYGLGAQGTGVRISGEAYKEGVNDFYWFATDDLNEFGIDKKLETYKELNTPYGATYYCFDCDRNGDFSDIVCLSIPTIAAKRYMIEDLGSDEGSDFDFNDIVVDVIDNGVKQIAKVRAMGGTLDFTIKIGNTTWTKSSNGFNPSTMYNTVSPDYSAVLATFEVTGWDNNNISVSVNGKDGLTWEIPFPRQGQAPMIVAMKPTVNWNIERQSVSADWFN